MPTLDRSELTTRQLQAETRCLQIIDAALTLFAQGDYAGTRLRMPAQPSRRSRVHQH